MFKALIKNTVISCAVLLVCWLCAFLVGLVIEIVDYIPMWVLILSFGAVVWAAYKTALKEGEEK